VLGLRDSGEPRRRQLGDPVAANAADRKRQASRCLHDRRELQLHARQGEAKRPLLVQACLVVRLRARGQGTVTGSRDDRSGEVGADEPEQEELAVAVDSATSRKILAQISFGRRFEKNGGSFVRVGRRFSTRPPSRAL
jgi:hypothetical protein